MNPYYSQSGITIFLGDCREVLPTLQSVDLVITSPPYNQAGNRSFHAGNNEIGAYDGYADDMPEEDYQKWQLEVLRDLHRVLDGDGSLFYIHKNRIAKGVLITPYSWLLRSPFILKGEVVWNQKKGPNCAKVRFFPFSERVYWLAKKPETAIDNRLNLPDVWEIVPTETRKQTGHPAVFPLKLVENILASCDGETVLDPFCGTGTTLVAAKHAHRKAIGCEISERFCELSANRLRNEVLFT